MENLESIIRQQPFWEGLKPDYFPLLIQGASRAHFPAGAVISPPGGEAVRFYLILKGEVALETPLQGRDPVVTQKLGPGDALGWAWLVPPFRWHFNVRALSEIDAWPGKRASFGRKPKPTRVSVTNWPAGPPKCSCSDSTPRTSNWSSSTDRPSDGLAGAPPHAARPSHRLQP